jgi:hypothetical protein
MGKTMVTLAQLKAERTELEGRLKAINNAILLLEPSIVVFMDWKEKALNLLNEKGCFVQTAEILAIVFSNQQAVLENWKLRRRYMSALSFAMHDLVRTGTLRSFIIPRVQGSFYGFFSWFNGQGMPLEKYYSKKLNLISGSKVKPKTA